MWNELAIALCLVLVIEGIMPFLHPRAYRRVAMSLAGVPDRTMRVVGLVSMLTGTALLYLIR
ncbi:MAG: DUF2065 family protein [Pseudomonadales bacterium]|jgi:uncharacterized protein YjeT (DUF2065 family)